MAYCAHESRNQEDAQADCSGQSGARTSARVLYYALPSAHILVNSLVLQEAKSSSEIDNIITTSDELYKALVLSGKQATPAVKKVID